MYTVSQIAKTSNTTPRIIRRLIHKGEIHANILSRDYIIGFKGLYVTTHQAALVLDRTHARVIQLIKERKLKAKKIGRDFLIKAEVLHNFQLTKPTGRPRKNV